MKQLRMLGLSLVAAAVITGVSRAADVGALIVPKDHFNKEHWELVYDHIQRGLDADNGPLSPGDTFEADALYVRFHTDMGQSATMDFDVGGLNPDGGDTAFYGGLGLRFLVYDSEHWRIGAHMQVHYAPNVSQDRSSNDPSAGDTQLSYDLLEVDGGITLAAKLKVDENLTVMPYAGPILSSLNLDGDAKASGTKADFSDGENQVFGGVVGIALILPEKNTLRLEARVFDDVSISAAAGIAF